MNNMYELDIKATVYAIDEADAKSTFENMIDGPLDYYIADINVIMPNSQLIEAAKIVRVLYDNEIPYEQAQVITKQLMESKGIPTSIKTLDAVWGTIERLVDQVEMEETGA